LGSSSRCTNDDRLRNITPSTIPTSTSRCRSRAWAPKSRRNSSSEKPIISPTSIANWAAVGTRVSDAAPSAATSAVWMSAYRASKPMIDGVRMRLVVTVWKSTVDTATA